MGLETRDISNILCKTGPLWAKKSFVLYLILLVIPSTAVSNSEGSQESRSERLQASPQQQTLDCQPGEQRHFNYESSTKVWGSTRQQVQLRATMRIRCMDSPTNSTLKYMAEILSLTPAFATDGQSGKPSSQQTRKRLVLDPKQRSLLIGAQRTPQNQRQYLMLAPGGDALVAEPVFEEVGEAISVAATRVKRSVSGWFSKTWTSVKGFFVNIFSSSEQSTISRDQAMNEHGIDIGNQCKVGGEASSKNPFGNGVPLDESVFDDLQPQYYIGASTDPVAGFSYVFDGSDGSKDVSSSGDIDADEDEISFFDDPKPRRRVRRATGDESNAVPSNLTKPDEYDKMLKLPFVFVQSKLGRIIEVRFSENETDLSIKNFKRHLCDLFTTNLDRTKTQTNEMSPIGKHKTKYIVDSSIDSAIIKDSIMRSSPGGGGPKSDGESQARQQQLVRALAVVVANGQQVSGLEANGGNNVTSRDPNEVGVQGDGIGVSVLRSINSTSAIQLGSRAFSPDIEQMQVNVRQVQQFNDGRLVGTAGQLGMSLLQLSGGKSRLKREAAGASRDGDVEDIADLLQVSTSFAVQLVPMSKLGNFVDLSPAVLTTDTAKSGASDKRQARRGQRLERSAGDDNKVADLKHSSDQAKANASIPQSTGGAKKLDPTRREPLVISPKSPEELQRTMNDLRQLESKLELSATNLLPETSQYDGQLQRLEILRDQIQMRLNEESVRNRLRRIASASILAATAAEQGRHSSSSGDLKRTAEPPSSGNDLGLGLTQLILGSGITSKHKGPVHATIGEVVELESLLNEARQESSVSRLLVDTIKMDKLKQHCKSSIASLDEIRTQSARLEMHHPFNVGPKGEQATEGGEFTLSAAKLVAVDKFLTKNRRKFEQCQRVLELMLRVSERRASDLVIELIDDCNERLLAGAKSEELGYGPASKYYRDKRQQFIELLAHYERPTDQLIDRLIRRLDYAKLLASDTKNSGRKITKSRDESEFVYVSTRDTPRSPLDVKYNKSSLFEEDYYNNNDGAGSLVMTITSLAAKSSIRQAKKGEVIDNLLQTLKGSSCSLFSGPDLDILESMGNFRDPQEAIVTKVIHLARRCRQYDTYVVACIHGLRGQLSSLLVQKFLTEQLKSTNSSCLVKSEIVLLLIETITADEFKMMTSPGHNTPVWPSVGINKLDETLIELSEISDEKHNSPKTKFQLADERCLKRLVSQYMSLKRPSGGPVEQPTSAGRSVRRASRRTVGGPRLRRAILNEGNFWDEATCKRWVVGEPSSQGTNSTGTMSSPADFLDELDDNSIVSAISNKSAGRHEKARGRNANLVEQESDGLAGSNGQINSTLTRRRHKCSASKTFGPKNAQATLKAEIVNDLVGAKDENKFLARFRLATNFLGNRVDVGRMYLWHQRQVTRAHANVLGKSLWDTSHTCHDKAPGNFLYMPLFDFNLWLVKVSVGLRLQAEMGFFSNCDQGTVVQSSLSTSRSGKLASAEDSRAIGGADELELHPSVSLRASGEASAKFVVARAGMSLSSQYGYMGNIRVSKQPDSCMSVSSAHQPMNVTFSSWFQLWDSDCHYWGSRNQAEPVATRWRLTARKPSVWIADECLKGTSV